MKTKLAIFSCLLLLVSCFSAFAAPERISLKSDKQKTRETLAKSKAKQVQVSRIEDPEARKAIQEIMNYMGLSQN